MKYDSIARKTIEFVREYPFIMYALKKDLINYSSLARLIQKETGIKNFDAILVSLRRYQNQIQSSGDGRKVFEILRNSKLEMRTGVNIYSLKSLDPKILNGLKHFHLIHGGYGNIELATDEKLKIKPRLTNLLEIEIKSPPIEKVRGFVSCICSALTERGINILKTYSCHGNSSYFVFDKKDLQKVVNALESIGIK